MKIYILKWTFSDIYSGTKMLLLFLIMRSIAQSSLTPCDPMDYTQWDSSVHEIFQAKILDGVAISNSKGSSWLLQFFQSLHWETDSLPLGHLGSPLLIIIFINNKNERTCKLHLEQQCPTECSTMMKICYNPCCLIW